MVYSLVVEPELAFSPSFNADDAKKSTALASTVGADEANDFALLDPKVDIMEDLGAVVSSWWFGRSTRHGPASVASCCRVPLI